MWKIIVSLAPFIAAQAVNGLGKEKWANGASYEGSYRNNKRTGQGTMTYADQSVFTGTWLNDQRVKGTFVSGGSKYEPVGRLNNFKNDKMTGKAKITWANGSSYVGDWLNGKRNGRGKVTFADKSTFEGTFVDGRESWDQVSLYTWPTGTYYKGAWADEKRQGQGEMYFV